MVHIRDARFGLLERLCLAHAGGVIVLVARRKVAVSLFLELMASFASVSPVLLERPVDDCTHTVPSFDSRRKLFTAIECDAMVLPPGTLGLVAPIALNMPLPLEPFEARVQGGLLHLVPAL